MFGSRLSQVGDRMAMVCLRESVQLLTKRQPVCEDKSLKPINKYSHTLELQIRNATNKYSGFYVCEAITTPLDGKVRQIEKRISLNIESNIN